MKLLPAGSRVWLFGPYDSTGNLVLTEEDFYYSKIYSKDDYPGNDIRKALAGDVDYYCVVFNKKRYVINFKNLGYVDGQDLYFMWVPRHSFIDV